jgi:signal transduction histidine kinase
LQELAANHEAVREQERTRIAREIHDELGQSLTTLRMKASLLGLALPGCDPELARQTDEMKSLIDQTIVVVRNVATKLRPGALDLGIVSAIDWLAQDFEDRTGIPCSLDLDEGVELDDERSTMVFRILQESLTNVVRHAQASHVEISFLREGDAYRLEVRDDGCGFTPDVMGGKKTFGLLGIRERATVLQGDLEIDSAPGAGTALRLRIPAESMVCT